MIVELDGPPHENDDQKCHDGLRDTWLRQHGYHLLGFQNDLVIGGGNVVLDRIRAAIERDSSKP